MRLVGKAGSFAVLLVALLFVVGFAGSGAIATAQDATATATGQATLAPTQDATTQATQDANAGQPGQTQGQTLDWMNIPMCVQVAATAEATADLTGQGNSQQATSAATEQQGNAQQATAAATEQQGPGEPTATLDPATTPFLGILAGPVSSCGIQVLDVFAGSPAETAQLAVDDVIVAVDNTLLADHVGTLQGNQGNQSAQGSQRGQSGQGGQFNSTVTEAFFTLIRSRMPGDVVTLTVQRNSTNMQVVVTLSSLPPELAGQGTPAATPAATATARS